MRSRTSNGFTLIELLVVIGIIAILSGILFPVFSKARAKGQEAACINNVKQILAAIQMYRQDFDSKWPLYSLGPASGTSRFTGNAVGLLWCDTIQPYVRNEQVFACPSAIGAPLGYGMNPNVEGSGATIVYDPTETVGIADDVIQSNYPVAGVNCADGSIGTRSDLDPMRDVDPRHTSGAVFGFVDGHAKRLKIEQTIDPNNMWDTM